MSDTFRVAVVAEGPTDKIVIEAAISEVFGDKPFILRQLQPEQSRAFEEHTGRGWAGVYRWCKQATTRAGGQIRNDPLFATYDLLIVHLDADVADETYANASIDDATDDLPCSRPCPPARDSTNLLRNVMLRWMGEASVPPKTVLCTPSKKTEAWVLSALYPDDSAVISGNVECSPHPENILQAKPLKKRLVTGGKKIVSMYQTRSPEISKSWHHVRPVCSEAERFSNDLMAFV